MTLKFQLREKPLSKEEINGLAALEIKNFQTDIIEQLDDLTAQILPFVYSASGVMNNEWGLFTKYLYKKFNFWNKNFYELRYEHSQAVAPEMLEAINLYLLMLEMFLNQPSPSPEELIKLFERSARLLASKKASKL